MCTSLGRFHLLLGLSFTAYVSNVNHQTFALQRNLSCLIYFFNVIKNVYWALFPLACFPCYSDLTLSNMAYFPSSSHRLLRLSYSTFNHVLFQLPSFSLTASSIDVALMINRSCLYIPFAYPSCSQNQNYFFCNIYFLIFQCHYCYPFPDMN